MKECNSCGKCCIKYSNGQLSAEPEEIEFWDEHRPDIFSYTKDGKIWVDPTTGKPLELCPFLKKNDPGTGKTQVSYSCDIYFDRPDDCRLYPSSLDEMINDDCEMIEKKDLQHPEQAKIRLELIMSDSWRLN